MSSSGIKNNVAQYYPSGWQQQQPDASGGETASTAASYDVNEAAAADESARSLRLLEPPPALPEGWSEHLDPASGQPYYYNSLDGTTTWDRPVAPNADVDPQHNNVTEAAEDVVAVEQQQDSPSVSEDIPEADAANPVADPEEQRLSVDSSSSASSPTDITADSVTGGRSDESERGAWGVPTKQTDNRDDEPWGVQRRQPEDDGTHPEQQQPDGNRHSQHLQQQPPNEIQQQRHHPDPRQQHQDLHRGPNNQYHQQQPPRDHQQQQQQQLPRDRHQQQHHPGYGINQLQQQPEPAERPKGLFGFGKKSSPPENQEQPGGHPRQAEEPRPSDPRSDPHHQRHLDPRQQLPGFADPQQQQTDPKSQQNPSDPRQQRPVDPRQQHQQHGPSDPRQQQRPLDPRQQQQKPSDPRHQQQPRHSYPGQQPLDPTRLQQPGPSDPRQQQRSPDPRQQQSSGPPDAQRPADPRQQQQQSRPPVDDQQPEQPSDQRQRQQPPSDRDMTGNARPGERQPPSRDGSPPQPQQPEPSHPLASDFGGQQRQQPPPEHHQPGPRGPGQAPPPQQQQHNPGYHGASPNRGMQYPPGQQPPPRWGQGPQGYGQPQQGYPGSSYDQMQYDEQGRPIYGGEASQNGGQLVPHDHNPPVRETLDRTWKNFLSWGNRTKEIALEAKDNVSKRAAEVTNQVGENSRSWFDKAKSSFGSVFEGGNQPPSPYTLSGSSSATNTQVYQQPPGSYPPGSYPPLQQHQQHYPPRPGTHQYPPGYGPPQPRKDSPYPPTLQQQQQPPPQQQPGQPQQQPPPAGRPPFQTQWGLPQQQQPGAYPPQGSGDPRLQEDRSRHHPGRSMGDPRQPPPRGGPPQQQQSQPPQQQQAPPAQGHDPWNHPGLGPDGY